MEKVIILGEGEAAKKIIEHLADVGIEATCVRSNEGSTIAVVGGGEIFGIEPKVKFDLSEIKLPKRHEEVKSGREKRRDRGKNERRL